MKIILLQDQPKAAGLTESVIRLSFPDVRLCGVAATFVNLIIHFKSENPDLIILNFFSPDILSAIKDDPITGMIPVLYVTESPGQVPDKLQILEAGAEAVISLPADEAELVARIKAKTGHNNKAFQNPDFERIKYEAEIAAKSFDAIVDAILLIDRSHAIVRFNLATEQLYNLEDEDISGKYYPEIIYATANPVDACPVIMAEKLLTRQSSELQNGDRWFKISANPILDANGNFEYCILIIRDITTKKNTEEGLIKSEARFRSMVESLPVAIYMSGGFGKNEDYQNPEFTRMFGYTQDDLQSIDNWWPLAYPDESYRKHISETWESRIKNAVENNRDVEPLEAVVTCKDGTKKNILFTYSILGDNSIACGFDLTAHRKTELALRKSEERNSLVLNATQEGIWEWDAETKTEYFSRRWQEIMGYEDGDPDLLRPTDSWKARIHPDDKETVLTKRNSLSPGNNNYYAEYRLLQKSGEYGWLRSTGKASFDAAGNTIRVAGSILDITDRKRDEEKIKLQNERLNAIIKALPDLLFIIDKDGNYLEVFSPWPEKMLIRTDHIIGNNIKNIFNPEVSRSFLENIRNVLETGEIASVENYLTLPDSETRYFAARIARLDADKVLSISRDMTTQVTKDIQIRKLSKAVEQSPVSLIITDLSAIIEYVNPVFLETSGYTQSELIGQNVNILKSGKTEQAVYADMWSTITRGSAWQGEWINKSKSDNYFWCSVLVTPILSDSGEVISYMAIEQDITARKEAESELIAAKEKAEESDLLKTAFLNNMSHEVRTPLNAIIGFSELMVNAERDDQVYFSEIIKKSSDQLLSLFEDTLYLSRLQSEKLPLNNSDFSPAELLADLLEIYSISVSEYELSIRTNIQDSLKKVKIRADESKIKQVLKHLISNAIKYTREGSVEIGFSLGDGNIEFYVSDTGIGISEQEQNQIFDSFYRGKETISAAIRGTGVGLKISRELVTMMGGSFGVESEPGKGSHFSFTLPYVMSEAQTEKVSGYMEGKEMKDLNVLIAEDELVNFLLLEYLIKGKVNSIEHARNGIEAVEMANEGNCDLVLMDINMPLMGGIEATKLIKANHPDMVIIAQSAYAQPQEIAKALEAGCDDFIAKPLSKEIMFEMINKHLVSPGNSNPIPAE